jgi:D-tyrosyl-tRNA(Tyr) deacylase
MVAVVQRVAEARVSIGEHVVSSIGQGILILLGIKRGDDQVKGKRLAERCVNLRIFEDAQGKFNYSLKDIEGSALVVSQFTLIADTSRGRRPSFTEAETPERAEALYENFITVLGGHGVTTKSGAFGEHMSVSLVNDGPVTIILEE